MNIIFLGMGMNWTRTSYLFLVVILISVGVTSAYAITITLGADPVNVQGTLVVDGDLDLRGTSSLDNDSILFDNVIESTKTLEWDNNDDRFEFSFPLAVGGQIQTGSIVAPQVFYNRMGTTITSFPADLNFDNDLLISGSLEVGGPSHFNDDLNVEFGNLNIAEGTFTTSGLAIINGDLDLTGFSAADDDTIFFDDGTTTFLRWDESPFGEFVFSDNVFIGGLLDVEALNDSPLFLDRTGSDGTLIDFARDGAPVGDIVVAGGTISYNPFTGSHYAWTTQEPQRGMVVSMNGQNKYLHDNPEAEILYGVDITTKKNDPAVLGTFLTLHEPLSATGLVNPHLVMAEGNGEVWVADMGVDIQPGDYLISSSVAGHAMKDDRSEELSHIMGRAAEPIDWSEVSETIDGVKHKKISILFNFVPLNNIVE